MKLRRITPNEILKNSEKEGKKKLKISKKDPNVVNFEFYPKERKNSCLNYKFIQSRINSKQRIYWFGLKGKGSTGSECKQRKLAFNPILSKDSMTFK